MAGSEPERDAVGRDPNESTNWSSVVVLVGIPMAYLVGFGIWLLFNVRLTIVIGCSSVLAWAQLIAVVNPFSTVWIGAQYPIRGCASSVARGA